MNIVDVGSGPPLVMIPGIQGRWEWMKPAVDALARRCRVVTFSLADEPTSGGRFREEDGFASYVAQVAEAMDQAGIERAALCGVSYGGLIASTFAARHPERTTALILVSALPPDWRPNERALFYVRAPRLLAPIFMLASLRLYGEMAAAREGLFPGAVAAIRHGLNALRHMFSPARMARRVTLLPPPDLATELGRLNKQTLIVVGEDHLDRVVPPSLTRKYLEIWPHAGMVTLERTGHLGLITRSDEFARIVGSFVERSTAGNEARQVPNSRNEPDSAPRRRIG
ncbi:MAG TPA: alpha/beta hydrolase [Vicinamibacterales bacterium]|nr:alpha/beta hydrolase [Vicinamibacterales bacterium]